MAETTAKTPLKLFNPLKTIITSNIRRRTAPRSSKFSASTILFSIQRVNYKNILKNQITLKHLSFSV